MSDDGDTAAFRESVEEALLRDDPIELMDLITEVALSAPEAEWAQACCVQLARHRNAEVRGNAVMGFGHIARRFGQLDPHRVKRLVELARHDRHEYVRAQGHAAVEDLRTFMSWNFEPEP